MVVPSITTSPALGGVAPANTFNTPAAGDDIAPEFQELEALQERNDSTVGRDMLGRGVSVGDFNIYPITLASITMLKQVDSPLIRGTDLATLPNVLLDILVLVKIHSYDLEDDAQFDAACDLAFDAEKLRREALRMAVKVSPAKTKQVIADVLAALKQATETQVKAAPPKNKGDVPDDIKAAAGMDIEGNA